MICKCFFGKNFLLVDLLDLTLLQSSPKKYVSVEWNMVTCYFWLDGQDTQFNQLLNQISWTKIDFEQELFHEG